MKKKLIIAIDGPAGSGKSTTAKLLAHRLGLPYIDTGAMYRAVTLKAMRSEIPFTNIKKLVTLSKKARIHFSEDRAGKQKVFLDGADVTKAIRLPELTRNVFYVAQEPLLRRELVKKQRVMGSRTGAVMEGRDIGTVVFPNAGYKFFLDASSEVRCRRRFKELIAAGKQISLQEVLKDQKERDKKDKTRKEGPLKRAKDAIFIDTSSLTIEGTVDRILTVVRPDSSAKLVKRYSKVRKSVRSVS